jgi:hypothetical protein
MLTGECHDIQASAENKNAGHEKPKWPAIRVGEKREHKQRNSVHEMVKDGFIPNIRHGVRLDCRSQRVRAKRAERNGKKANHGRNSNICHVVLLRSVLAVPLSRA